MHIGAGMDIGRRRETARETEVCDLIVEGLTSKEIAQRLGISPRTVDVHVRHLRVKYGMSRAALTRAILKGEIK